MSSNDPINHALDQLVAAGLDMSKGLLLDGAIHRVDVDGDRKGKKNGWYIAHEIRLDDGRMAVVGSYGIWQGRESNASKLKIEGAGKFNAGERQRIKDQQKALAAKAEADRLERAAEAALKAKKTWLSLYPTGTSDYLQRKGVKAHGVRFASEGRIAIPLVNVANKIVGLQWIKPDGDKRFSTGMAKLGAWHLIGEVRDDTPIVLAEGYATAASIFEATGFATAVCFDVGNVIHVGKALRSLYPRAQLLIAADDDHERLKPGTSDPENLGRLTADKDAAMLKCVVAFPRFNDPAGRKDFNDMHAEQGLPAVHAQIHAAIKTSLPPGALPADEELPWQKQLVWGDEGLKAMVRNVMIVLEHHPAWRGVFAFDEFSKRLVMRKSPPHGGEAGPLTDGDEIEIAAWFGRKDTYRLAVPTMMAREASIAVGRRHRFHPVRDYLDRVKPTWDKVERIPRFFSDFCGVEQSEYAEAIALKFFIACVARIRKPGCKARLMLVIEGKQDINKSTLARVLCGEEYFADLGTAASDKDFFQIIQGRWIVEISELASFARGESSHIKRAISVNIDRFRPSYGRNAEDFKRECIFFGTVNNQNWQKDETGGTRYMPIWVNEINIEAVTAIRDQLWAEACVRYDRGEDWWKLPESAKEEQESRYEEDLWTHRLVKWLEGRLVSHGENGVNNYYASGIATRIEVTSASEILSRVFNIEIQKQDMPHQMRIGRMMTRIGWERFQLREAGARIWKYRRVKSVAVAQPEPIA